MARLAPSQTAPEDGLGEYLAKDTRIDCDLCRQTAPLYFARKNLGNSGATYLQRQPHTHAEHQSCRDALEACPVEAIGYKLF
jgi:ferredoxin